MGRYKTKLQSIQEANKRILLEKIVIRNDEGDIYTVEEREGNLSVETPDFNRVYKMTKVEDDGKGGYSDVSDLTLNFVREMPNGELMINVTGYLWILWKTKESIIPKDQVIEIMDNIQTGKTDFIIEGGENTVRFTKIR
tara:strand:+ start:3311 stop:3727 length:417 start_codon:yes stop_codon:yes gene_type:complete